MWHARESYYSSKSGFYRPIGGVLYGGKETSYIGIQKNAITTHTKCLVEQNNWGFIENKALQQNIEKGRQVWAILREPMSHLESGFSEVEHYPAYSKCVAFLKDARHNSNRFQLAFERWLAADERCKNDPTAVYCCIHKDCAPIDQEAGWAWTHIVPQMWNLDFWTPLPDTNIKKQRGMITTAFDMHSLNEVQGYLNLEKPCHKENARKSTFNHDNVKHDVTKNATLEKAVCAFYARDYFCLGYELPSRCRDDPEILGSICDALLPP
jgi:hypothetical protein